MIIVIIIIIIIIKKICNVRLGESELHPWPCQSEVPSSTIPTKRKKEEKIKT